MGTLALPQFESYPSCFKCELSSNVKNPGVATRFFDESLSQSTSPLIVVGMNPGTMEDKENKCFVGPSGRLLENVYLSHDEILKHPIYLTNAARCATLGNEEKPKRRHYRECWGYTDNDINKILDAHSPHIAHILCLGADAYDTVSRAYLGKSHPLRHGFNNQGQANIEGPANMLRIYTTFHPAAILRNKRYLYPVSDHMELLSNALNGKLPTPSRPNVQQPRSPRSNHAC